MEDVLEKANVPQEDREVFLKFQEFVGSIEMIKLAKTLNIMINLRQH